MSRRGRGRPPLTGGPTTDLTIRVPELVRLQLDAVAEDRGCSRAEAARYLLRCGWRAHSGPSPEQLRADASGLRGRERWRQEGQADALDLVLRPDLEPC